MLPTLHAEDGLALDFLLDRAHTATAVGPAFAAGTAPGNDRLVCAEKILNLLLCLPDIEPPHDLIGNTLRRVHLAPDLANPQLGVAGLGDVHRAPLA